MWLVDPDSYYERVGPASEPKPEPTELEYSGFLHLDGITLLLMCHPPLSSHRGFLALQLELGPKSELGPRSNKAMESGPIPPLDTCLVPHSLMAPPPSAGALFDFDYWPKPYIRHEASAMVKIEGTADFIADVLKRRGDVLSMRDGPAKHLILEAFQRRLVHNAMALARVCVRPS